MKILVTIAAFLGIALIGVSVWAYLTVETLDETRIKLAATEDKLAAAKNELATTASELKNTKNRLEEAQEEIADLTEELEDTSNELSDTKAELSLAASELRTTKSSLKRANDDLADTEDQLEIAQETLEGLGISIMSSRECRDVRLVDNSAAEDPTWEELKAFLKEDKTENNRYIRNEYDCSEFSRDVHNNAEAAGIRAAEVQVQWESDRYGHALNAFLTKDYGLVYIDCTGGPDTTARVVKGKKYRGIEPDYITPKNIRNDLWWDSLMEYYYISTQRGTDAITSRIIIYW
jgi:peptidoglycan hydrolase CwlO-like protein